VRRRKVSSARREGEENVWRGGLGWRVEVRVARQEKTVDRISETD
jgi:hypothetical protein